MPTHAPHLFTTKPRRGRMGRLERRLPVLAAHHASAVHAVDTRLIRRGPRTGERALPVDLAFRVAAGGVILAAAVLGIAMGLAQPSWLLAAALVGGGALIAAVVALTNSQWASTRMAPPSASRAGAV